MFAVLTTAVIHSTRIYNLSIHVISYLLLKLIYKHYLFS